MAKASIAHEIHASGVISGIHEALIVSQTQGTIEEARFALGQKVAKGDVLLRTNDAVQKAAFEQAQKAAQMADLNLGVVRKLYDAKSAAEAELAAAEGQALGAHAAFEASRKAYTNCSIIAPISGYVAQKDPLCVAGNVLAPGATVARIVDISSLKTTIAVGEMDVAIVKAGLPVAICIAAAGNNAMAGRVTAVGAGSDPSTGSYPVEIVWPNTAEASIKSGMSARVAIVTHSADSALLVPATAVVERDRKSAVFTCRDGKAAVRFVELGRTAGNNVEVVNGVDCGAILITTGVASLALGDPVAVTLAASGRDQ
jgi:RND family efflux transporter MFP subunit